MNLISLSGKHRFLDPPALDLATLFVCFFFFQKKTQWTLIALAAENWWFQFQHLSAKGMFVSKRIAFKNSAPKSY